MAPFRWQILAPFFFGPTLAIAYLGVTSSLLDYRHFDERSHGGDKGVKEWSGARCLEAESEKNDDGDNETYTDAEKRFFVNHYGA